VSPSTRKRLSSENAVSKPFLYTAVRYRLVKKKFEPMFFPMDANSSELFFARAIFPQFFDVSISSLIGSSKVRSPAPSLTRSGTSLLFAKH